MPKAKENVGQRCANNTHKYKTNGFSYYAAYVIKTNLKVQTLHEAR
jgi:hypothetical protein